MKRSHVLALVVAVAAALGLYFAGVSTYDFVLHLDRDVHNLHCSFTPGLSQSSGDTSSGCHVALMSPYSSVLRTRWWGGLPIALPAMSVYAFLLYWVLYLFVARRTTDRRATGFLLAATLLPVGASAAMAYIAVTILHAVCKLCIGMYAASGAAFLFALWLYLHARGESEPAPGLGVREHLQAFVLGVLFVAVPVGAYAVALPDYGRFVGRCGRLEHPEDPYGVMVALGTRSGPVPAIEVLDPLCPACRSLEQRLEVSGLDARIRRNAVLFPLDNTCNWMVSETVHAGACTVSEAVLCAGPRANEVMTWAFEQQERIRDASRRDRDAARRLVVGRFPDLASCIGSAPVRARLNRSLRWTVSNRLQVLTPQLYVDGAKLCDEDTDLGLEFALSRMLAHTGGTGR
jgi:uncharacterized membrane protein